MASARDAIYPGFRAYLRGVAPTVTKVTFLGAGSTVFARQLITDILHIEGLDEGTIALVDIDQRRLEMAHKAPARVAERTREPERVGVLIAGVDLLSGTRLVVKP